MSARVPRLHVDAALSEGASLQLDRARSHQLGDVLRLREGAVVEIFDGRGNQHAAEVHCTGKRVRLAVGPARSAATESPLGLVLLQGVSRGDRMDATVRQATELGVSAIRPVLTRRASVRLDEARAAKRQAHWRGIVVSACEQCGRARLPALHPVAPLEAALREARAEAPAYGALSLQLDPDAGKGLGEVLDARGQDGAPRSVTVLIGPESGLDADEIAAARAAGFVPVRSGPRTLRTETAGPAVLAVLQARFGDLST